MIQDQIEFNKLQKMCLNIPFCIEKECITFDKSYFTPSFVKNLQDGDDCYCFAKYADGMLKSIAIEKVVDGYSVEAGYKAASEANTILVMKDKNFGFGEKKVYLITHVHFANDSIFGKNSFELLKLFHNGQNTNVIQALLSSRRFNVL